MRPMDAMAEVGSAQPMHHAKEESVALGAKLTTFAWAPALNTSEMAVMSISEQYRRLPRRGHGIGQMDKRHAALFRMPSTPFLKSGYTTLIEIVTSSATTFPCLCGIAGTSFIDLQRPVAEIDDAFDKAGLDYPSLDVVFNPVSLLEALSMSPDLLHATNVVISACALLSANVSSPPSAVFGILGGMHLAASLTAILESNTVDILREHPEGLDTKRISELNGVASSKLARILRQLSTHHIFQNEQAPTRFFQFPLGLAICIMHHDLLAVRFLGVSSDLSWKPSWKSLFLTREGAQYLLNTTAPSRLAEYRDPLDQVGINWACISRLYSFFCRSVWLPDDALGRCSERTLVAFRCAWQPASFASALFIDYPLSTSTPRWPEDHRYSCLVWRPLAVWEREPSMLSEIE